MQRESVFQTFVWVMLFGIGACGGIAFADPLSFPQSGPFPLSNLVVDGPLAKTAPTIHTTTPTISPACEELECAESEPHEDLSEEIRGVVLLGPNTPLLDEERLRSAPYFLVENLQIPGGDKTLQKIICNKYMGKKFNSETILSIKIEVINYYEQQDFPFVEVKIPNQDITLGVLQLVVTESRVGNIRVQGARYTTSSRLEKYLSVKRDGVLNLGKLRKDVNFMNLNPFRRVDLIYGPGSEPCTTDISLIVEDCSPYRFYTGFDNTGVENTGRERFLLGTNLVLGNDHMLTYQYTSAYQSSKFHAHTGQYSVLLPWTHMLTFYGGYSAIHASLPFPSTSNHGSSWQASGRYTIPLVAGAQYYHDCTVGADFKRTNNTVSYSATFENIAQPVNLSQFMARYSGSLDHRAFRIDFDAQLFWSPGPWLGDMSDADYNRLRPDAKNQWVYLRGILRYLYRFSNGWCCELWGTAQVSSQNLLPSEQLGIGGYDTVRGYEERQLNYDGGIILNGEIRSPALSLIGRKINKVGKDALQFLLFLDYGYGRDHNIVSGAPIGDYLLGTGPGVRYTLNPWLTARLDWGIKLHRQAIFTGGETMVHFALSLNI